MSLGTVQKKEPTLKGDSARDWAKMKEGVVLSQSMAPRPRNSKGNNMPPAASELVGENEMTSRKRNEEPLVEHEVVLR